MSSTKRKAVEASLQRRVKARRESSEEFDSAGSVQLSSGDEEKENPSESSESNDEDQELSSSESEAYDDAGSISFGALVKAHTSLTAQHKQTKAKTLASTIDDTWADNEAAERKAGRKDHRDFNRSSKHAPTEISSKKAVSRKRDVVPVAKREYRDPRFETFDGPIDQSRIKKAYSFLDDYRNDEIQELKNAIKTTKDENAKEKLKRALMSMESRKKAQMRKDKEQEILDNHRKEEKDLVKQGKKPFYLKKAEQKKRVLLDQFGELKGKQLDHVIERRRKKVEGKEKKKMPFTRRAVE